MSKKLRDPDADKSKKDRKISLNSDAVNEISSQTLRAIVPGVQPLSESELKLGEEGSDNASSLGSLSDGELRQRKFLLQQKLKGLEQESEGRRKESKGITKKRRQSGQDRNGYADEDDVEPDEEGSAVKRRHSSSDHQQQDNNEEEVLRKAAHDSMKAKLAKKEELKRKNREEDRDRLDKKKTKKVKEELSSQRKHPRDEGVYVEMKELLCCSQQLRPTLTEPRATVQEPCYV